MVADGGSPGIEPGALTLSSRNCGIAISSSAHTSGRTCRPADKVRMLISSTCTLCSSPCLLGRVFHTFIYKAIQVRRQTSVGIQNTYALLQTRPKVSNLVLELPPVLLEHRHHHGAVLLGPRLALPARPDPVQPEPAPQMSGWLPHLQQWEHADPG